MFVISMLGCGLLGVAIERFAYRPLRNAPRIAPLISALGVSIFLQNSALLVFGASFRDYNTFSLIGVKTYHIGDLFFSVPQLLAVLTAIGLMVALTIFVARSRLGKAMRCDLLRPGGGVDDGDRRRPGDRGRRSSSGRRSPVPRASCSASSSARSTTTWALSRA